MYRAVELFIIFAVGLFFVGSLWFAKTAFEADANDPLFSERHLCLGLVVASALTLAILLIKKLGLKGGRPKKGLDNEPT